jgi:dynein heavy chain
MQKVTLRALPTDEPWTVEEFLERTEDTCHSAAVELNRMSLMVEEAVEEVLDLVKKAAEEFEACGGEDEFDFLMEEEEGGGKSGSKAQVNSSAADGSTAFQQQQDWSIVWEYCDSPHKLLLQAGGGLSKVMQDIVRNAVAEMRRYYSRKVVDVLIKVTRHSLDCLRKRFISDSDSAEAMNVLPVFLLHATLMIPRVVVRPSLEDVQEALIAAGKFITNVSKGIGQWTGGKVPQVLDT